MPREVSQIQLLQKSVLVPSVVIEGWLRECATPQLIEAKLQQYKRDHTTNWTIP